MINKASRKKSLLVELMETQMNMSVTGNETIEQLKLKALNQAYACSPAHPQDPVGFGTHAAKDIRGGGQPGAILPRVGHHDHEGGIVLSATETSGRVGGHIRGSSTDDGGEERPPQRRKSPTRPSRQDGYQRLRGTPAFIGHHGQFGEPGGDLDQGAECSQGPEGQEDTDRRGRGFFERLGQDELGAVGSMIAESMVVTPESSGEHLLGSEYETAEAGQCNL